MSYTLRDWFSEHAQVHVRVPAPEGSGQTWVELWVPASVLDSEMPAPAWMDQRLSHTDGAIDFLANYGAHTNRDGSER